MGRKRNGGERYKKYLRGKTWRVIRAQRLALDKDQCVLCGKPANDVHHRRYPKKLGTETINDLVSLCRPCHDIFHKEIKPIIDSKDKVRVGGQWLNMDDVLGDPVSDKEPEPLSGEGLTLEMIRQSLGG